jgi:acetolactate synthase-1/2/3 large subunit
MFFKKRYASTEMVNPDFVTIASGYSIPGQKVVERESLLPALKKMLAADGPYLLEVVVEKQGNVLPMVEPGASVSEITLNYK